MTDITRRLVDKRGCPSATLQNVATDEIIERMESDTKGTCMVYTDNLTIITRGKTRMKMKVHGRDSILM